MADITVSVNNTNLFSITSNEVDDITYTLQRATCKGNTITYVTTQADSTNLPSDITLENGIPNTYQFYEDGLYRLITDNGTEETYYVRATANIEACERALIQDLYCNSTDCDKYQYNQKIGKLITFISFKDRLYRLLETYQQEQSSESLISIPEAERLTVCQYFCILLDICGPCIEVQNYTGSIADCGCNS